MGQGADFSGREGVKEGTFLQTTLLIISTMFVVLVKKVPCDTVKLY